MAKDEAKPIAWARITFVKGEPTFEVVFVWSDNESERKPRPKGPGWLPMHEEHFQKWFLELHRPKKETENDDPF